MKKKTNSKQLNMFTKLTQTTDRLIGSFVEAEKEFKTAETKFKKIKGELGNFTRATDIFSIENAMGKVTTYENGSGMFLDPNKVRSMLSKEEYDNCLVYRKGSMTARFTSVKSSKKSSK